MSSTKERQILTTKFFAIARTLEHGKTAAYLHAKSRYPGKIEMGADEDDHHGLRQLTIDELRDVVNTLNKKAATGHDESEGKKYKGTLKKKRGQKKRPEHWEAATPVQLDKIDIMRKQLGLTEEGLEEIAQRVSKGRFKQYGYALWIAQNLIEALKNMKANGWKPGGAAKSENPPPVKPKKKKRPGAARAKKTASEMAIPPVMGDEEFVDSLIPGGWFLPGKVGRA